MKCFFNNIIFILAYTLSDFLLCCILASRLMLIVVPWNPMWDLQLAFCTFLVISLQLLLLAHSRKQKYFSHGILYFFLVFEIVIFVLPVVLMIILSPFLGAYSNITSFFKFLYWLYAPLLVMIIMLYNRICLIKRIRCIK